MAKEERRGNREIKKPKKVKPKETVAASPFATKAGAASNPPGKKKS